ncbi:hypothetical protein HO173_000867 [Letharia columbiana]|uniref:Aminotransferase class V domain-containing protein n=1 Tax=Letharia columbiana TaxID=112416 RepID=A0A8H6G5V7_9LECA|nr:uncharacterized protein HO173_000867 [Letharia columbiana]KAF6241073.1 hypothetical protein HO173_000867 [Letharia columbiana]
MWLTYWKDKREAREKDNGKDGCPYPKSIECIRKEDYPLLEETTYLDHAGTTPYPRSLMKEFERDMNSQLFGNPHSNSPSSMLSTDSVESARLRALNFFKADPEHFDLIFVANATAAIKTVVDCLSDYRRDEDGQTLQGSWYGYHADSHTSLVGARETSRATARCFESDEEVENWLHMKESRPISYLPMNGEALGLFAYPAQSNMNGRRLPLDWPARLRSTSKQGREVYSLLDAAAYVATSSLDLSNPDTAPDFTALSFYKIFGFPDLGALIVRKAAGHVLKQRRYFGGGTVDMVVNGRVDGPSEDMWHANESMSLHEIPICSCVTSKQMSRTIYAVANKKTSGIGFFLASLIAASSPKTRHSWRKAELMLGRWDIFILKVLLVAEEAMAMWTAGSVLEERLERS